MAANSQKITVASDAQVFRGKDRLFYFIDTLADSEPQGPFGSRDRAEAAADGVRIDRFYSEVVRLEEEPQPAAECDACEYLP